jgi:hypothetical protein
VFPLASTNPAADEFVPLARPSDVQEIMPALVIVMMPANAKRGQPGEDLLDTHWERQSGGTTHYLWVGPYYVEWRSHDRTPASDNSQHILHDPFLDGEYQEGIEAEFGNHVLQEVIYTIRHGSEVPRFVQEWRAAKTRTEFWKSIPIDATLVGLGAKSDDDGSRHYRNVKHEDGSDETVIRAENVELHLDGWHARFVFDRPRLPFLRSWTADLDGNHSAALAHGGRFYIADNHVQVFGLHGLEHFSTRDLEERSGLGSVYRVVNVLRAGDRVMAEYHDFHFNPPVSEIGDRGYLEVHPDHGIVGRCVTEPTRR